jgi:EpsD family peptidyl-prolyl cis-trans isomerase
VVVGAVLALAGLLDAGKAPVSDETAALVNGTAIPVDELNSLLERRARGGAPGEQLHGTLDDMIDEELLIQRALELGILRRDSNVRVAIIQAMEKSILNEERGRSVPEDAVRGFYREHPDLFTEPRLLQLEEIVVSDARIAPELAAALAGGASATSLAEARQGVSATRLPPVPLSPDALSRRYPEDVLARVEVAAAGDVLTFDGERGVHLLKVVAVREAHLPAFEDIRLSVLDELQMQRLDAAYEDYLAWLRQRADIRINERVTR